MANVIDGLHLIVDGTTNDPSRFDGRNLKRMMVALAHALEMTIIEGPTFKQVELEPAKLTGDAFQDEGGISGYCMISTSHISIHCWPLRRVFMADLFSCKGFDGVRAVQVLREFLDAATLDVQSVRRQPHVPSV